MAFRGYWRPRASRGYRALGGGGVLGVDRWWMEGARLRCPRSGATLERETRERTAELRASSAWQWRQWTDAKTRESAWLAMMRQYATTTNDHSLAPVNAKDISAAPPPSPERDSGCEPLPTTCLYPPHLKVLWRALLDARQRARITAVVNENSVKFLSLCKPRLSSLVLFSTLFGYLLSSGPAFVLDLPNLLATLLGTGMTIASANAMNQYLEVDFDLQMKRTKCRVLPSRQLTLNQAFTFALANGVLGAFILGLFSTYLATFLAVFNLFLYVLVYTPLKRIYPLNTWVGALVGAIPPLIGYTAHHPILDPPALFIASALFFWQIPHFYSLSWPLRHDYQSAGYKMLANVKPLSLPRQNLVWTLSLFALPLLSTYLHLTSPWIILETSPLSLYCVVCAYRFFRSPIDANATICFKSTLLWLPVFLLSLILHKTSNDSEPLSQ